MSRTRETDAITRKELDIGESDLSLDPEGLLDEDFENPDDVKRGDLEDIERETLQKPDPAAEDLPDRAFDRIAPSV